MIDRCSIEKTYRFYAPMYDFIFGSVFNPGRKRIADLVNRGPARRVLELGVGTGISLPFYSREKTVVGVDLSGHMLAKARKRRASGRCGNASLALMDAEQLAFRDGSFDAVILMYVVSVVADPGMVFREVRRVCREGGDVYVLNHFSNSNRVVNFFEKLIMPVSHIIGFRSNFSIEENVLNRDFRVVSIAPVNMLGYWTLVHMKNEPGGAVREEPAPVVQDACTSLL